MRWTVRLAKLAVTVAVVAAPLVAWPSEALAAGCFYMPASALAQAFGFAHASSYLDTAPDPYTSARDVFSLCRAVAWEGSTPTNPVQVREKAASGMGAAVVIKTEEPNGSSTGEEAERWEEEYLQEVVDFLKAGHAVAQASQGSEVTLPAFGAEHDHAFVFGAGPKQGALGIWYDEKSHAFITIGVTARIKDPAAALKKIAAKAVTSFGL
jgi:hypothetical protein